MPVEMTYNFYKPGFYFYICLDDEMNIPFL